MGSKTLRANPVGFDMRWTQSIANCQTCERLQSSVLSFRSTLTSVHAVYSSLAPSAELQD
jgi:hypothetical protein